MYLPLTVVAQVTTHIELASGYLLNSDATGLASAELARGLILRRLWKETQTLHAEEGRRDDTLWLGWGIGMSGGGVGGGGLMPGSCTDVGGLMRKNLSSKDQKKLA